VVRGDIDNGGLGRALQRLATTLDKLDSAFADPDRLNRARWDLVRRVSAVQFDDESLAASIALLGLRGQPPNALDSYFALIPQTSEADLRSAWSVCKGTLVLSLVGDEATLVKALEEAGLAAQ
jgi:hypothetical protein